MEKALVLGQWKNEEKNGIAEKRRRRKRTKRSNESVYQMNRIHFILIDERECATSAVSNIGFLETNVSILLATSFYFKSMLATLIF